VSCSIGHFRAASIKWAKLCKIVIRFYGQRRNTVRPRPDGNFGGSGSVSIVDTGAVVPSDRGIHAVFLSRSEANRAHGQRVSAADGRVTRIEDGEASKLVSVFLSPFDVHVNRSPIAGVVNSITYTEGKKVPATSNEASSVNERNALVIEGSDVTVTCTQIAGILARRIVCWPTPGEGLARGQRFGLIKFGSRTDLRMPGNVELEVKVGDRVRGGETIIGRVLSSK